jgi:hypothetical protein
MHNPNARIAGSRVLRDLASTVVGTVVDDDDLEVIQQFRESRYASRDHASDDRLLIVRR